MSLHDVYAPYDKGTFTSATSTLEQIKKPGLGSWLAVLFMGVCSAAWVQNEQAVAWLLSQGIVGEGVTRTLPSALRWASVGMALLSLVAAQRIGIWSLVGISRWGPAQGLASYIWAVLRPMLVPLRSLISATVLALGRVVGLVLRPMRLGSATVVHAAAVVLTYVWRGMNSALRYLRLTFTTVGYLVSVALGGLWSAVSSIARAVVIGLDYLMGGAFAVAVAVGLVLQYVWLRVWVVIKYVSVAVITVLTLPLIGVTFLLKYVWLGSTAITGAVVIGLDYLLGGAFAVVVAVGRALRYVWLRVWVVIKYVSVAVITVLTLPLIGITFLLKYVWVGSTAIARVVVIGLGYLMGGVYAVAVAVGLALHYLWLSVLAVIRYLVAILTNALIYAVNGVTFLLRLIWVVGSAVVHVAAAMLGFVWSGIATIGYLVGVALGGLWSAVSSIARAVVIGLGYLMGGVYALGQTVGLGVRDVAVALFKGLGFLGTGVSTMARGVGLTIGRSVAVSGRTIGLGLGNAWVKVLKGLGWLWTGVAVMARILGLPLRYVGAIILTGLGYLGSAIAFFAGIMGQAFRYVGVVALTVLGFLATGISAFFRTGGVALRYVGAIILIGLGYLGSAIAFFAGIMGQAFRYVGVVVVTVLGFLETGISAFFRTGGVALRYVVARILTGLGYLWQGVSTMAQGITMMLRQIWTIVFAVLGKINLGAWTIILAVGSLVGHMMRAVSLMLRPVWQGTYTILNHLRLGVSAVVSVLMWTIYNLWHGSQAMLQGLIRSPLLAAQIVGTAFTVSPDVLRAGLSVAKHRKGVSVMSERNLTRERLLSLVVTVVVFFTAASVGVRAFWPAPPEPTVVVAHWTTGHLTRDGLLKDMAEVFNAAAHRVSSGTRIVVEVYDAPSELQGKYLSELLRFGTRRDLNKETNGYVAKNIPDPTIVTPSSAHWLVTLNHEVKRDVVDLISAQSIVRPVIGIVTYEDMARCLGWPEKELGFADIIELRNDPQGWKKYDCARPEWGQKPLLAFTDPTTSSTGRSLLLGLYAIAADKLPRDLSIGNVNSPEVVAYVKEFQGLIDHYLIGTTVLNTKIYQGPRYGHFFIMPEDNLIHLYEGTEKAYINGTKTTAPPIIRRMVMIYPKEGSMPRNNCACIVQADWVSEEQVEASRQWIDFIREDEQQRAFMAAGFRPGTDLPLNFPGSKITSRFGLDPDEPKAVLNPSLTRPEVAAAIDDSWELVKRPGIVTFVVDTSGSMMGGKINQARDGLTRALGNMARNNQVGFLTFDDTINTTIPVGPLMDNHWDIEDAILELRAGGETALYDAIKAGIEMTEAAEGEEHAIRAVVVLTDGRANRCRTRLDDLIRMEASNEKAIKEFAGCDDGQFAVDIEGKSFEREHLIGTELVHASAVQVFFLGIGDDADMEVGRLLAEATGAEFQGVAEEDLANVLEEFSKYF